MTSCETGVLQNNPLEAGHDPKTLAEWYRRPILKADAEVYLRGILLVNGDFFGQIYGIGGGDRRKSWRVAGLPMINNDYTSDPGGV
jgi:hypothetical protein